jgi:Cd2+/Zn2+-exporting ATPase
MEKLQIKINILLPEVPDERDACVQRIIDTMQKCKGVTGAHITGAGPESQLCLHYDPDIISIAQVEVQARKAGAAISAAFGHMLLEVAAFHEMNQASGLEHELRQLKGIISVSVSGAGLIRLEFEQSSTDQNGIFAILDRNHLELVSGKNLQAEPKRSASHEHNDGPSHDHAVHDHTHDEISFGEDDGHNHGGGTGGRWKTYLPVMASLVMLLAGIAADQFVRPAFFTGWVRLGWYGIAYIPVGFPVAAQGLRLLVRGDVFTEFVLMTIATLGAFFIGEYPEGVAVMLFYNIGELFQDAAVNRAKRSIKALLDIRPASVFVKRDGQFSKLKPQEVQVGDIIRIKAGDKVPLDGEMLSEGSSFNTAALTGESKPSGISKGEPVLAGMINQDKVVELKVTKLFNDSSLARILTLVQEATTRKAKTEQFIRRFSRVYTPIVVVLAVLITLLPYFFLSDYVFHDWLYRALIFLVISCPCALVISIPLGYFGGIGAASRNGILFKGSNFLDLVAKLNTVVMDKTGTLTKGVFKVQEVKSLGMEETRWLPMAAALEAASTHPVAQAVVAHAGDAAKSVKVEKLQEISGHGIQGVIDGKQVLAGNLKLMKKMDIQVPEALTAIPDTIVVVAVDGRIAGYLTIADEIKEDSAQAIRSLRERGIRTLMLSGDKQAVVDRVAKQLGVDEAFGDLLPEDKVRKVEAIKADRNNVVAFVGDGINDAPVLALSDVGMAMGGLGSDAAIETADVIIQTDQPSRISRAIQIGVATNRLVWQNIIFAFVVKAIVLGLGAGGLATMWEAVFADVGVALLAVLNAMRIQRMRFS